MHRRQKGIKKHPPTTRPSPVLHQFAEKDLYYFENKPASEDIREQLRATLEQLEHNRLTSDLQVQKRLLLQQQLRNSQQQNDEQHAEIQQLRKELSKLSKKYGKIKEKKACDKCKGHDDLSSQLEKQRQIYANDRKMMQDQIKSLKIQLQNSQATQQRDRLLILTESLHKEVQLSGKKIEQQTRIIHFLNEKLSQFQIQNIEIIKKVDLLQGKLSQMEIDSILQKKRVCPNCSNRPKQKTEDAYSNVSRSRQRRNGSIQNVKKTQRDEAGLELERYQP